MAPDANVLPQPAARRNGKTASLGCHKTPCLISGMLLAVFLLLSASPLMAASMTCLDWHFDPERDLRMVRMTPETSPTNWAISYQKQPNPIVLPQLQWPEQKQTSNRGWQLIDPSVGLAGVQNSDETRSAVKIAENQQSDQLAQKAAPVPGQEELPGPLSNIGLKVTMGVQYVF